MNADEIRYKYRIQYTKGERVKYISHLDFLRSINRAFRRAKLPIRFSNGFNPHTLMTIALPCSVGITSVCECLDIEMKGETDPKWIRSSLNNVMPVGIEILQVIRVTDQKPLSDTDSAIYTASFTADKPLAMEKFIAEPEILIEKKSKRGMKEVNIKSFVRGISVQSEPKSLFLKLQLHLNAGSQSNIKPELVLSAMQTYFGASFTDIKINREQILFDDGTPLFE